MYDGKYDNYLKVDLAFMPIKAQLKTLEICHEKHALCINTLKNIFPVSQKISLSGRTEFFFLYAVGSQF